MKTLKSYIWMAAATMMVATFGACSSEDLTTNESPMTPEKQGKVVTLTATLGPKDGTTTRSVMTDNLDGTISTAWEVGDKICVNYDNNSSQKFSAKGEVSAVDGSGNATITVKLIDPKDASIIVFGFPYDHGAEGKDPHIGQLGTLEDINLHHAAISGIGSLSVSGSDATLPTSVSMNKEMCIWKFTFKDGGVYTGTFKDDHFEDGTFEATDGSRFEGHFSSNNKPQKGVWYDKNGKVLEEV